MVFVCENNLYGASTRIDLVMKNPRIADRASSYGFAGETVDGNDVEAVCAAAKTAAARCREGSGPVLLELLTYRQTGHSRRDARAYQPEAERKTWAARDPIEIFAARLEREGVIDEAGVERMRAQAAKRFAEAVERARSAPQPSLDDLESDVFALESAAMKRQGIAESLRDAIAEEMERDPRVFCIGEDIGVPGGWGGAFTVTLNLEKRFPGRILNTPIAELGFFGVATGAAIMGMRPIVDVQYGDFLFLASDQIVNNAAKLRYMSGGQIRVPMVMRAPVGATGRSAQHAQSMERYFIGVPGLKVVAPSNAFDAKGLLKAAVRDDNPVMMFEHKLLYGSKGARAEPGAVDATSDIPDEDYTVPLHAASVLRPGSDMTIFAWLLMAHFALHAADQLAAEGIDAEVIDVRALAPLDWPTLERSARKTGRALIVEEGAKTGGLGAEIAAGLCERVRRLRFARLASSDTPVPFSPALENAYRPDVARIVAAARRLAGSGE